MAFKQVFVNSVNTYDKVIELMTTNGWQNISSKPTPPAGQVVLTDGVESDWDVLKSLSNNCIYQLRPFRSAAETGAANHTIVLTDDVRMNPKKSFGVRMLADYTPVAPTTIPAVMDGEEEVEPEKVVLNKGINTINPNVPWLTAHTFATENANPHTQDCAITVTNVQIMYDITSERAIFIFRYPSILGKKCSFLYFGIPESVRGPKTGPQDSIFATTMMQGLVGNKIRTINYPFGVGDVAVNAYLDNDTQLQLPLRNPSYLKEYWLTPIYYGLASIGMRGRLDGIFALAANIGLIDKDQIMVGSKIYEVVELAVVATNCSFNAGWMAVELDPDDYNL